MLKLGNKVRLVNWPEINHTKSKQMYWKPDQQMETERSCKIPRSHSVQGKPRKVNCQVILQSINATKTKNTAGSTDNDLPRAGLPLQHNEPLRVQKELCQMFLSFNGKAFWGAVGWGRWVSWTSACLLVSVIFSSCDHPKFCNHTIDWWQSVTCITKSC